jgi:inner membrane protein
MPTPFSHPATVLALAPWFRPIMRPAVLVTAVVLVILPDIDILGLRLGVPYGGVFGHRGFTHSLFFAALCALPAALALARRTRTGPFVLWVYLFLVMASHGVLDACTDGGRGVAFFSPFDATRYRFSWHPIRVAMLSPGELFSARGWTVMQSEMLWVWCPALAIGLAGIFRSRR